jgi:diguanylate cyclase (GGDEF)-like protein
VLSELTVGLADVAATQRLGVMCIDIDGFHMINESFGHAAGDAVLAALARRLIAYLPHTVIGRFGGDEFLVIVPAPADRATFERFAAQVHHAVAEPFVVDGRKVMLSASLGAVLSRPDSNAADLLRDADVALSEAKRAGTSQLRVFNEGMASKALKRLIVREELRAAIAAGEFVTHYQPLHQLSDHARVGFEALVRWDHPRDGLLAPAAFLPIAEEFGLIIEIGEAVLRQVCRDISLHSGLVEHVSINVSAVELDQPNWLSKTLAIVQESGVDPARLMFELTETAVMSSRRKLHADLSKLRALGADVLVDDFGTGYSSISLLRDLPVSGLKLDRSFVAELTSPTGSTRGLADGLAQLSRSIGIKAIAEGIETAAQRDLLMTLGWTYGQGWLYGKPAPLETWIDL